MHDHVPLSHDAIDTWAMAMVSSCTMPNVLSDILKQLNLNGAVTLRIPPNNKLFDSKSMQMSPVLQRRQAEQQNTTAGPTTMIKPYF